MINDLAEEGWRLFSTMLNPGSRYCYYHFEREKK